MTHLLFRDHKMFLVRDQWNPKLKKHDYDEQEVKSLIPFLTSTVTIGREFTFGDLWALIEQDAAFIQTVFDGILTAPLVDYIVDSKKKPKPRTAKYGIQELRIGWHFELNAVDETNSWFSCYPEFLGYGLEKIGGGEPKPTSFAIDMTPLCDLLKFPLRTNQDVRLREFCKGERGPTYAERVIGKNPFKVYDLLSAVIDEITFHGSPKRRQQQLNKLKDSIKECDEHPERLIPMEVVMHRLRRQEERMANKAAKDEVHLTNQYKILLKHHNDTEALPVKKFFMENRSNAPFQANARKINEKFVPEIDDTKKARNGKR